MAAKRKILIVDDSDLISMMIQETLESEGFDTVRAENGVEGIEKAYKERPDLIILDVEMPVMKGYQASRLLKSRRGVRDIPIVMHTSCSEDRDKMWAYSSGADAYIVKDPENTDALLEKVKELIETSQPDFSLITHISEAVSQETIIEMLNTLNDFELFNSTILNMLADIGKNIEDLDKTVENILKLTDNICDSTFAVIHIPERDKLQTYIYTKIGLYHSDIDRVHPVCMKTFSSYFPDMNTDISNVELKTFGNLDRLHIDAVRTDGKDTSSMVHFPLFGKGNNTIATLHIGNSINNYFSESISESLKVFSGEAGLILENALLFHRVSVMEMQIRNVFSKFVPSDIIDSMIENQSQSSLLSGEKREAAVLFSDIRSFTALSEHNEAEDIVSFLNEYFDLMCIPINKYGGTIDKYIGDAILAIFGAPKSYEDNTLRAVRAALGMAELLEDYTPEQIKLPFPRIRNGIGIHVGELIVGNIGSKNKFDYTVIGDTVNLASRLEGLTKHYRQKIIVSEEVKNKLGSDFYFRELDTVKVKGKKESTRIYTVTTESDENNVVLQECRSDYSKALKLYKMRNWNTAIEYFNKTFNCWKEDFISKMYIDRCRNFLENPPPEDWDGSEKLDFK